MFCFSQSSDLSAQSPFRVPGTPPSHHPRESLTSWLDTTSAFLSLKNIIHLSPFIIYLSLLLQLFLSPILHFFYISSLAIFSIFLLLYYNIYICHIKKIPDLSYHNIFYISPITILFSPKYIATFSTSLLLQYLLL